MPKQSLPQEEACTLVSQCASAHEQRWWSTKLSNPPTHPKKRTPPPGVPALFPKSGGNQANPPTHPPTHPPRYSINHSLSYGLVLRLNTDTTTQSLWYTENDRNDTSCRSNKGFVRAHRERTPAAKQRIIEAPTVMSMEVHQGHVLSYPPMRL